MQDFYNTRQYPPGGFAPKDTSSLDLLSKSLNQFVDNDLRNSMARAKMQKEEERKAVTANVIQNMTDELNNAAGNYITRNNARLKGLLRLSQYGIQVPSGAFDFERPTTPKLMTLKNATGGYEMRPEQTGPLPTGSTPISETPNGPHYIQTKRNFTENGKEVEETSFWPSETFNQTDAKPVRVIRSEKPADADPFVAGSGLRKSQMQEKIQQLENKNNEFNVDIATQEAGVKRNADGSVEVIDKDGNPKTIEKENVQAYKDAIERQKTPFKTGMLNNLLQIIEYKKMLGHRFENYQQQADKLKQELGGGAKRGNGF